MKRQLELFAPDIQLAEAPWYHSSDNYVKNLVKSSKNDPPGAEWWRGTEVATGADRSIRVVGPEDKWQAAQAPSNYQLARQHGAGSTLQHHAYIQQDGQCLIACEPHHGSLLDMIHSKTFTSEMKTKVCKDVTKAMMDAKCAGLYPKINLSNLVLTSPTANLSGGFCVKLAGLEHAKCWSDMGVSFVRNHDADDIQQGMSANMLICSPLEAGKHHAKSGGYTLTSRDLAFRVGLTMLIVQTGQHPGGGTGEAQLKWIRAVGKSGEQPVLDPTMPYAWSCLLKRLLHGDPKKRAFLRYVVGSVVWRQSDPLFFGQFITATVDACKNAAPDSGEQKVHSALNSGKKALSSTLSDQVLNGKSVQDILGPDKFAVLWERMSSNDHSNIWDICRGIRNNFKAHLTPQKLQATQATGCKDAEAVFSCLMTEFPTLLPAIAELVVEHKASTPFKMLLDIPPLLRDDNGGTAASTMNTGEQRPEERLSLRAALDSMLRAPDARDAASALPSVHDPSAAAKDSGDTQPADEAAGGVSDESPECPGLSDAAAAGLERQGRKRGYDETAGDDEGSIGIGAGLGAWPGDDAGYAWEDKHCWEEAAEDEGGIPWMPYSDNSSGSDFDDAITSGRPRIPAPTRPQTDYELYGIGERVPEAADGAPKYHRLSLTDFIASGLTTTGNQQLLLRPARLLAQLCTMANLAELTGRWDPDVIVKARASALYEHAVAGRYGPGIVRLAVDLMSHGLSCSPDDCPIGTLDMARLMVGKLYDGGASLPQVDEGLAVQLRLLLPLVQMATSRGSSKAILGRVMKAMRDLSKAQAELQLTDEELLLRKVLSHVDNQQYLPFFSCYKDLSARLRELLKRPLEHISPNESLQQAALMEYVNTDLGSVHIEKVARDLLFIGDTAGGSTFLPRFSADNDQEKEKGIAALMALVEKYCSKKYVRRHRQLECCKM